MVFLKGSINSIQYGGNSGSDEDIAKVLELSVFKLTSPSIYSKLAHPSNKHLLLFLLTSYFQQSPSKNVDFSWNKYADPKFTYTDESLLTAVKARDPEVDKFFKVRIVI